MSETFQFFDVTHPPSLSLSFRQGLELKFYQSKSLRDSSSRGIYARPRYLFVPLKFRAKSHSLLISPKLGNYKDRDVFAEKNRSRAPSHPPGERERESVVKINVARDANVAPYAKIKICRCYRRLTRRQKVSSVFATVARVSIVADLAQVREVITRARYGAQTQK